MKSISRILPIALKIQPENGYKNRKVAFYAAFAGYMEQKFDFGVEMPHNMEQMGMSVSHKSTENRRICWQFCCKMLYAYCSQNMNSAVKFTDV